VSLSKNSLGQPDNYRNRNEQCVEMSTDNTWSDQVRNLEEGQFFTKAEIISRSSFQGCHLLRNVVCEKIY